MSGEKTVNDLIHDEDKNEREIAITGFDLPVSSNLTSHV